MNFNTHIHTPSARLSSQLGYIGIKSDTQASHSPALLAHALDEIACGVIILDAQGHLLHCNLAGRLQLERRTSLQLDKGIVSPVLDEDANRFQEALNKALKGKRSMINLGQTRSQPHTKSIPATIAMVPLNRHAEQDFTHGAGTSPTAKGETVGAEPQKCIALIFSRTGMCESLMLSFYARAYQLTRSEEQILGLLCTGLTAPEMAAQLCVGEATVRTHIRSICAKTDCNGIREVTKRLALLPPLMAAVMPAAFA